MGSLAAAQIALVMVLLTAGGLLVRSVQALLRVNPGLDPSRVLTFQLELPMATTYPTQPARDAFFANLLERVAGLPGVSGATMATAPPLEEESSTFEFTRPGVEDARVLRANFRMVARRYFSILGIPLRQGRLFQKSDGRLAARVVIVSESLARLVWGTDNPIGTQIEQPLGGQAEVVGVVGDVRTNGLDQDPGRTIYVPASQWAYNFVTIIVKARSDPSLIEPAIRTLVRELGRDLPLHHVRTMKELVAQSVAPQCFQMLLVGTFSLLVFVLAIIGTYGVTSYGVSERTGELGIRMALGATEQDIKRLVLRQGAGLAAIGIAIGGIGAAVLSRILSRFVFQISTLDPVTFAAALVLLASAVLAATFVPAHRATRVDPIRALRVD